QAEDGIRDFHVTGVQTCALPISDSRLQKICRRKKCGKSRRTHWKNYLQRQIRTVSNYMPNPGTVPMKPRKPFLPIMFSGMGKRQQINIAPGLVKVNTSPV